MRRIARTVLCCTLSGIAYAQSTERASVSSAGVEGNGDSDWSLISEDGQCVFFRSRANLVAGGDGVRALFVHDRSTGQTTCVSVDSAGQPASHDSNQPWGISADGRYVLFNSISSALVGPLPSYSMFVHDRQTAQTSAVSVDSSGALANENSSRADISADGRYVAFESNGTNLVAGDTNASTDVFVHDRQTGQTTRVSVDSAGVQGNNDSEMPSISADGRFVAFASRAWNLVPGDTNGAYDVFRHDRQTGVTIRVSVDRSGFEGLDDSYFPKLSSTGDRVLFSSWAQLIPEDADFSRDLFVRDLSAGWIVQANVSSSGSDMGSDVSGGDLSADGRFVAMYTGAALAPGERDAGTDVFVHDLATGQTTRASVNSDDIAADRASWGSSISGDGRFVCFDSTSEHLVPNDLNLDWDVFVRDRGPERVTPFCFGDGSLAACPCGNSGAENHGCATAFFPGGAYLGGYGTSRVGADTLLLQAEQLTGNVTLFYQGDAQQPPTVLDDGLSCVSGAIVRLGTKANVGGVSSYPQAGDLAVSIKGVIPAAGGTRYYQGWYRHGNVNFCPPATTNRTNGLIVVWAP
jgi:Tol biopolymer transport system component